MRNFDLETCPTYGKDTVYCGMSWHPELSDMLQEREKVLITNATDIMLYNLYDIVYIKLIFLCKGHLKIFA